MLFYARNVSRRIARTVENGCSVSVIRQKSISHQLQRTGHKTLAGRPSSAISSASVTAVYLEDFVRMHMEKPEKPATPSRHGEIFVHYVPSLGKWQGRLKKEKNDDKSGMFVPMCYALGPHFEGRVEQTPPFTLSLRLLYLSSCNE